MAKQNESLLIAAGALCQDEIVGIPESIGVIGHSKARRENLGFAESGGTISGLSSVIMGTVTHTRETLMANGVLVQVAVLSVLAAILMCMVFVYMRRRTHRETTVQISAPLKPFEAERQTPQTITMEMECETVPLNPRPPVVLHELPATSPEHPNQRILAGISENIRKSPIKPLPSFSPIQHPETPRDTEYVRIKKQIITPHGQVRFSILKDSIATNMLAVFRRACLDWKTPNDLISFLPPYLEPEAEILDNQLLLIGTPGHNEKLAIPIRSFGLDSSFRDCFDFITDGRTAKNTPAVLLTSDDDFEIVSRGVITQPVFLNPEPGHTEVTLVVESSAEALQNS